MPDAEVGPDDLMMLIFTSGTSGDPKAVNVTQAKVAYPGQFLSERFGLGPDDVAYLSMPMFHSNAIMAGWGPALAGGRDDRAGADGSRRPGSCPTYAATARRTPTTSASR